MKILSILSAVLVIAGIAGVAWQRTALADLRAENQRLRDHAADAEQMTRQNSDIARLRVESQEIAKLRVENQDLHKLRNEARQIREQVKGLASVRAENARLRAAGPRSVAKQSATADARPSFTLDTLSFAGYATPEATLQTMFWAAKQGDFDAAMKCFSDEARKEMIEESPEDARRGMEEMLKRFKGLRIAARRVISADEIQLGIQLSIEGNDRPDEQAIRFKLVGGEWRLGSMK